MQVTVKKLLFEIVIRFSRINFIAYEWKQCSIKLLNNTLKTQLNLKKFFEFKKLFITRTFEFSESF